MKHQVFPQRTILQRASNRGNGKLELEQSGYEVKKQGSSFYISGNEGNRRDLMDRKKSQML